MVVGTAVLAHPPTGDAVEDDLRRYFEAQHGVERVVGEDGLELLGLRQGAGEAVEHEAAVEEVAREPLVDHLDDGRVGDELAGIHVALRFEAGGRSLGRGGAKQLPGGEVLDAVVIGEARGLRAFAGALLAEKYEAGPEGSHEIRPRTLRSSAS